MIRWKQSKVHKDRRERKDKITSLKHELDLNDKVVNLLKDFPIQTCQSYDSTIRLLNEYRLNFKVWETSFTSQMEEMKCQDWDSRWGYPTPDPFSKKTSDFDQLMSQTLDRVAVKENKDKKGSILWDIVQKELEAPLKKIKKRTQDIKRVVEEEEAEAAKKLTSEDMTVTTHKTVESFVFFSFFFLS